MNKQRCTIVFFIWIVSEFLFVPNIWAEKGDILFSFQAPSDATSGLAWDGSYLWAASQRTAQTLDIPSSFTKHDPQTGQELCRIDQAPYENNQSLVFSDIAGNFWTTRFPQVSNQFKDDILLRDFSGEIKTIYQREGTLHGIAYDLTKKYLYLLDSRTVDNTYGIIYTLNSDDGRDVRDPITLNILKARDITFDGTMLWIVSNDDPSIYRVDPNNGEIHDRLELSIPSLQGIAWDGSCLWVNGVREDIVFRIDHGQEDLSPCTEIIYRSGPTLNCDGVNVDTPPENFPPENSPMDPEEPSISNPDEDLDDENSDGCHTQSPELLLLLLCLLLYRKRFLFLI